MSKKDFSPELFKRALRKSRQYNKASDRNKPIAREWFQIANDDIQVSKLLIKNKHYAASVYHLQQVFEKITKSYHILFGRMEPEQAKVISFRSLPFLVCISNTIYSLKTMLKSKSLYKKLKENVYIRYFLYREIMCGRNKI